MQPVQITPALAKTIEERLCLLLGYQMSQDCEQSAGRTKDAIKELQAEMKAVIFDTRG